MALKVYRAPSEIEYKGWDFKLSTEQNDANDKAHSAALKALYEGQGYTGPNTGRIYREHVADGYAQYMVFEAPRGSKLKEKFFLIHLPYVDGYQSRTVHHMTKKGLLELMEANDRFSALFG